jgi:uncharacterized membrane protein
MNVKSTARLEAFSDGVLAIIITISVLNFHAPAGNSISSVLPLIPLFFVYIVSFQTIATYWNNHHHLLKTAKELNSSIMWANTYLLFWLSLIPFGMEWLGNNIGQVWPTATFCFILLMSALAYYLLSRAILHTQGKDSTLARALGKDIKGKISLFGDLLAVILAFSLPWISYIVILLISIMWFIPDKRLEMGK